MSERVEIRRQGAVAEVVLNRPEKRNALDMAMFDALFEAGETLRNAKGLRAVLLRGKGAAFCAGIDTSEFQRMMAETDAVKAEMLSSPAGAPNRFQRPATIWGELPVPVIAVVQGVAFGGGLQLALGADFRIAAPEAQFSIMEARWGLIPDMGITQSLPRLMRADHALDLILTARIFDAVEAERLGLVTCIAADPLAEARAMAARFAAVSPDVLRSGKRLVQEGWTAAPGAALRLEAELQVGLIAGPNQIEAVVAGLEKRAPQFHD